MPTGYTAAIADGITFREFALTCARQFGACVTLRDEPMGGEHIPEKFEESDYSKKAMAAAILRVAELEAMSEGEIEAAAAAHNAKAEAEFYRRKQQNDDLLAKYKAMLAEVEAWAPPTKDHVGMKDFMRQQIAESIKFDCYKIERPIPVAPLRWHSDAISAARNSVNYYTEEVRKERERVAGRNGWIAALRESLPADEDRDREMEDRG
jgi:hypothetical protein